MKTRGWIILFITLWMFIGSIIAVLATRSERDYQLRGYRDATATLELPYRVPRLGINVELTQYTEQEIHDHLNLMMGANIRWVRQFIRWDEIEPERGVFEWEVLDQIIPAFADYPELSFVAVITNSPAWTHQTEIVTAPPDNAEDYANFVTQFIERYGKHIDYYQIWDEPNIQLGWGGKFPNATEYSVLLQSAYTAIHQTDSTAEVIAAALAPNIETGSQNISDVLYLDQLYQLGLPEYVDIIAAKPYGYNYPAYDRDVDLQKLNFSRIILIREVMERHNDGKRPLWASNWGWNSLPDDWRGDPSIWGDVTHVEQNQYIVDALYRAEDEWPWLGAMILQHWQPDLPQDHPAWGFSLLSPDDAPTPLYDSLAMQNTSHIATNGLYPAQNQYATYEGIWEFSELGADIGWVQDSHLNFEFQGESVSLLLRRGDYVGYLYPQLEEEQPLDVPYDVAENPYISLRSANLDTNVNNVLVADDLPDLPHRLTVVADELVPDEITNRWSLVGYAVSSGNLAVSYNRQITTGIISAIVSAIAGIVTLRFVYLPLPGLAGSYFRSISANAIQIIIGVVASVALMFGSFVIYSESVPHWFRRDSVQLGLSILTSGFIYLNPGAILTLIAMAVLFVVILNRLELGLALVIFWVPFFLFPVELFQYFFPTAELIFYITLIAWAAQLLFGIAARNRSIAMKQKVSFLMKISAFDWMVVVWVILGFGAVLNSEYKSLAMTEFRTLFIQPSLFYLMLRTSTLGRQKILLLVDALILAGVVVALIGLYMWVDGNIIQAEGGARRLQSVYGSPNNVALLLGRIIPFLLAMLFVRPDQKRFIFSLLAAGIVVIALLLTQSAGALFIGVPVSLLAILLMCFRKRAVFPVLILGLVFMAGLAIASQTPRFERMTNLTEGTNFYRIRVWQSTLNILEDHPISGIGLDQFLYEFRDQYMMPDAWEEPDLSHPHNLILDFWSRLGLVGVLYLIFLTGLIVRVIYRAYSHAQFSNPGLELVLLIGVAGSLVNIVAHGMVDNSVFVLDLSYIFFLLLAILATLPDKLIVNQNRL